MLPIRLVVVDGVVCAELPPPVGGGHHGDAPHEQHTPGRGPASVAISLLPQGVGLLPTASSKSDTRFPLRAAAKTTPTCDEASL